MSVVLKTRLNPDKDKVNQILERVKDNDGYCPCRIKKTEDTKCMCKEFREQKEEGFCHCELFQKVRLDTE